MQPHSASPLREFEKMNPNRTLHNSCSNKTRRRRVGETPWVSYGVIREFNFAERHWAPLAEHMDAISATVSLPVLWHRRLFRVSMKFDNQHVLTYNSATSLPTHPSTSP